MNAPVKIDDPLADAREEAYRNLSAARHYITCAMRHLEIADDCGTLYDLGHARAYFRLAMKHLEAPRAAMRQRLDQPEGAA